MDLATCKLYEINRRRDLAKLLRINSCKDLNNIYNSYNPYISNNKKKRLIEPITSKELKQVQKCIQKLLKDIIFDENIFSGIPGKSYIDNGRYHLNCKYIVAFDISKFFPNISREKVYNFFKKQMKNSSDVAKILTDICTIDIDKISNIDNNVIDYMNENKIRHKKHIPTGSPISCIMSYLANIEMFNEIIDIAEKNKCKVSIYVDDIVISSNNEIKKQLVEKIASIIRKNGYNIQKKKLKFYGINEFKRVTGNIISKSGDKLVIPNKIRYRVLKLKHNKKIDKSKKINKLRGYDNVIKQIKL